MDLFKVKTGVAHILKITPENYLNATGKKHPYIQKNSKGDESYFAVCPECENPIQIIGLFKSTAEGGRKPYGKHTPKTIPQLAQYSHPDYLDCSYANPKWIRKAGKRSPGGKVAQEMLGLLREQFDRIIYLLQRDTDVYISYDTAKRMLQTYLANEGWLYRTATLNNLPWTFGEVESALPLFGRKIRADSPLYKALAEKCPDVELVPLGKYAKVMNRDRQYINLSYLLLDHKRSVTDEHLTETIDFWVYKGNAPHLETIFRKTITIETDYFMNLIHPSRDAVNRSQKLLALAKEFLT